MIFSRRSTRGLIWVGLHFFGTWEEYLPQRRVHCEQPNEWVVALVHFLKCKKNECNLVIYIPDQHLTQRKYICWMAWNLKDMKNECYKNTHQDMMVFEIKLAYLSEGREVCWCGEVQHLWLRLNEQSKHGRVRPSNEQDCKKAKIVVRT